MDITLNSKSPSPTQNLNDIIEAKKIHSKVKYNIQVCFKSVVLYILLIVYSYH